MYEHILTRFGCPSTIMINQGIHLHQGCDQIPYQPFDLILRHNSFIVFYPKGNGQI
jgi:hypothetical protein